MSVFYVVEQSCMISPYFKRLRDKLENCHIVAFSVSDRRNRICTFSELFIVINFLLFELFFGKILFLTPYVSLIQKENGIHLQFHQTEHVRSSRGVFTYLHDKRFQMLMTSLWPVWIIIITIFAEVPGDAGII